MNLLNLILSAVLSGIMSYVAIVNISGKTKNLKSFISYLLIFLPLLFTLNPVTLLVAVDDFTVAFLP